MILRARHIIIAAILLFLVFVLVLACAGKRPEPTISAGGTVDIPQVEFPVFRWDKNRFLHLDISAFPDSISFFLPVGDMPLDMDRAVVLEDIFGWADSCRHRYIEYGVPSGANVVVVEDISASMGDYVHFTDRLIWGYLSILADRGCEVSLVRFGEGPERTLSWMLPDSALFFAPESLSYPGSRGSDLSGALVEALDLVAERFSSPAAVALFSDGDFPEMEVPYHIIERAERYGVSINVFLHGESRRGALAEIARATGGVYLVQPGGGFSPGMVAAVMDGSYAITYYPVHREKDGILHRIALVDPDGNRFRGEYRAPGEFHPIVLLQEPFVLPEELLSTNNIPFRDPGNVDILPEAGMILDAVVAAVNSLPDTLALELHVRGYACNLGPTGSNMQLSKRRANSVAGYLGERVNGNVGFDISWFGEMYPLNANSNDTERRENRRVEISLRCVSCG